MSVVDHLRSEGSHARAAHSPESSIARHSTCCPNLDPRNSDDDRRLVFVDPGAVASYPANPPSEPGPTGPYGKTTTGPRFPGDLAPVPASEPEWTRNGTYMVVRISTFDTTPWDDLPQIRQETAIGRFKVSVRASISRMIRGGCMTTPRSSRIRQT
jgi:hypothetical protein